VKRPDMNAAGRLLAERGRVGEGDAVLILTHDEGLPLADALYVECYRHGAVPLAVVRQEEAEVEVLREVAANNVARVRPHLAALVEHSDVVFFLYSQEKDPALFADVARAKLAAKMESRAPIQDVLYDGRRRVIITDFPTAAQAAFFEVDYEKYHDAFWRALDVEYDALAARVGRVASFMEGRREVHITSAAGTDVHLNVAGRPVFTDDGLVGMPAEGDGDTLLNLPCGEVCLAPHEDGAEGTVVFDFAFVAGTRIKALEVRFTKGRATLVGAAAGFERAVDFFAAGTGDPYVIAELGIGANTALVKPFGSILMDEKIAGTAHLALGDNRTMGGGNSSSVHQDMMILGPRLSCDGELLLAEGEIKI